MLDAVKLYGRVAHLLRNYLRGDAVVIAKGTTFALSSRLTARTALLHAENLR